MREVKSPPPSLRDLWDFFLLTFILTTPVWAASAATGIQLLPSLPVAAFSVVCPAAAALFLSARRGENPSTPCLLQTIQRANNHIIVSRRMCIVSTTSTHLERT